MEIYRQLKKVIYLLETLLGVFFIILANALFTEGSFVNWLVSMILFVSGLLCCIFGATTFRLRDDPDIWR